MTWRVARSLDVLLEEINAAAPSRSKISDGSIGDAAHASRDSDHNPWVIDSDGDGVVRARDFTHDPAGGLDCNKLAAHLASLIGEHPALGPGSYVIWNRRIISRDRISEGWRPYTGSNPHDHHLHQSVTLAQAGYDSSASWGWPHEEDPMAGIELKDIRQVVAEEAEKAVAEGTKDVLQIVRKLFTNQRVILKDRFGVTDQDLDELLGKVDDLVDQAAAKP